MRVYVVFVCFVVGVYVSISSRQVGETSRGMVDVAMEFIPWNSYNLTRGDELAIRLKEDGRCQ